MAGLLQVVVVLVLITVLLQVVTIKRIDDEHTSLTQPSTKIPFQNPGHDLNCPNNPRNRMKTKEEIAMEKFHSPVPDYMIQQTTVADLSPTNDVSFQQTPLTGKGNLMTMAGLGSMGGGASAPIRL